METTHRLVAGDARELTRHVDDPVELVVTSPPYPMIEMWDDQFATLDPEIEEALADDAGETAFQLMHEQLDTVWAELASVVVDGGVVCINVGDATRSLDGNFRTYHNAARITRAMVDRGFFPLPDVLWRKPTNSGTKFLGSGMVPPNAYVTLEHEYVLIFRKGEERRSFEPGADRRYEAAYFWEERNEWFSDVWEGLRGEQQRAADHVTRDRTGAFPIEVPSRLIAMYSAYEDTVLDPFCGTGTTVEAAMLSGRHSIGLELDPSILSELESRIEDVRERSRERNAERLRAHNQFVREHRQQGGSFDYDMAHFDMPVKTKQERRIRLYEVDTIVEIEQGYRVTHRPTDAE